jgi:flagellar biosynthesis/type III secretory pathway protein FliH
MSPSSKRQSPGVQFRRIEPVPFSATTEEDVRTLFEPSPAAKDVRAWLLPGHLDYGLEDSPLAGDVSSGEATTTEMGGQTGPLGQPDPSASLSDTVSDDAETDAGQDIPRHETADAAIGEPASSGAEHKAETSVEGQKVDLDAEPQEVPIEESAAEKLEQAIADAVNEALDAEREVLREEVQAPYLESVRVLAEATMKLNTVMTAGLIDLAHRLAEALIRREVKLDPKVVLDNLDKAIHVAGPMTQVVVDCHPREVELLRKAAPALFEKQLGQAVELLFAPTASLEPGDIVIRFEEGMVDAKWQTQLQRLTEALREAPIRTAGNAMGSTDIPSDLHPPEDAAEVTEPTDTTEDK